MAIRSNAAISICVQVYKFYGAICSHISISLDYIYLGVEFLGDKVTLYNISRNCHTVLQGSCTTLHSHQQCTDYQFPHPHQYCLLSVLLITVTIGCEVVSYCGSGFHFLTDWWRWARCLFVFLVICIYSVKKCLFKCLFSGLSFHSLNSVLWSTKVLDVYEVKFINLFLLLLAFLVSHIRNIA